MAQAHVELGKCEAAGAEGEKRAVKDGSTAYRSKIYPVGSEYALVQAVAQLMSAVVSVLNENLTESMKGFFKMRKAFATLLLLKEAEEKYMRQYHPDEYQASASAHGVNSSSLPRPTTSATFTNMTSGDAGDDSDDELEFVDAEEALDVKTGLNGQEDVDGLSIWHLTPENSTESPNRPGTADASTETVTERDFRTITSDPIDIFVHSGVASCLGLINLILSFIPPTFAKLISVIGFRGDRRTGIRLLWSASHFNDTVFGAASALVLCIFHNAAIASSDILTHDSVPHARLQALLDESQKLYPKSRLWMMEQARMAATNRDLEGAVRILSQESDTGFKQVLATTKFHLALDLMLLHRFRDSARCFLECIELNNWSHSFYYYMAGANYIELYRDAKGKDPERAQRYAEQAKENLALVAPNSKRRVLGRQAPMEIFVNRKITKWHARAAARAADLVDAVGVSPCEEMAYLLSGLRERKSTNLETALQRLAWSEDAAAAAAAAADDEAIDERAMRALFRAACLRSLHRDAEAVTVLEQELFCYDLAAIKACPHADNYALPCGHYEMGVCIWQAAGGERGDREELQRCKREIEICAKWETFQLSGRVGLKITTARESLRRCGVA